MRLSHQLEDKKSDNDSGVSLKKKSSAKTGHVMYICGAHITKECDIIFRLFAFLKTTRGFLLKESKIVEASREMKPNSLFSTWN